MCHFLHDDATGQQQSLQCNNYKKLSWCRQTCTTRL